MGHTSEYKKQWKLRNKDKVNAGLLRARLNKYGISKFLWDQLVANGCTICGSKERLCIDHNHTTDKFRGLLCSKCNSALGLFKDDPIRLTVAIQYLKDRNNG
jgi:hypothetical protein